MMHIPPLNHEEACRSELEERYISGIYDDNKRVLEELRLLWLERKLERNITHK